MKIGFIGLGNVGGKLSGSLLRNGHDLTVYDLNGDLVQGFVARGAKPGESPAQLMCDSEVVITCHTHALRSNRASRRGWRWVEEGGREAPL